MCNLQARQQISLSGFCLSSQAVPPTIDTHWTYTSYDSSYYKSPVFESYRSDSNFLFPYFLTPRTRFVGQEEYVQRVHIPSDWKEKRITLELERVHIVSHVWVNGQEAQSLFRSAEVGKGCRSLAAPHRYDLTGLILPGQENELRFIIDNRLDLVPVGSNSYSVSDNDQGNWNGFVGEAKLLAQSSLCLLSDELQVYPHLLDHSAEVVLQLGKSSGKKSEKVQLRLTTEAGTETYPIELQRDSQEVRVTLHNLTQEWNEYTPHLYHLSVELLDKRGKTIDEEKITFGMREVSADEHFVHINGRRTFLRGTVDGAQFPLTGYPPTDLDFWTKYCLRVKEWGMNLVRFHSWCPPEAAFRAADSLGIYLQVESSSWPNHDVILQEGNATARYIDEETEQILRAFGNHPSFILLSAGNEPKGRDWVTYGEKWLSTQQKRDPRHLYYAFAVGGSWPWCPSNQIHVRAGWRGLDWHRRQPESNTDFNDGIDTLRVPFIGHEVGQWCSYPAVRDIENYTGMMRPGLLVMAQDALQKRGMLALADSFLLASGRLQVKCYKHEMERLRRTRNYGGYNLQALADYTGQGGAPEGVLNVFYEPKGYVSPQEWLQWAGEVVPLMRTPRFTYLNNDTLTFTLEVSNLGKGSLERVDCSYIIRDAEGRTLREKIYPAQRFEWGGCQPFANERVALSDFSMSDATRLNLQVRVGDYVNDWDFWIYPPAPDLSKGDIYVTRVPDAKAQQVLAAGGKVLMIGYDQVNFGRGIDQRLLPQFWNHLWMPKYSAQTCGLLIRNEHPLFRHFPTSFHSDVQWWELISRTYPMVLEQLPQDVVPIVQSIDTPYRNLKMGMLFEVRVGEGRLVMTNLNLLNKLDKRIVARQLLSSILQYMQSDDFQPSAQVDFNQIVELYTRFSAF